MKKGCVYFIGAGPGDPELMTLKGKRLLGEAQVVVYAGSLIKKEVLDLARGDARFHDSAGMTLEEIMKVMVEAAREGKKVARLHSGDPSIYGALMEQIEVLEKEGIPYEIIPGVSSVVACAASLKRELTLPGVTQTVIITRLEGNTPVPASERLSDLARHRATMCILLSVARMERVVEELLKGYPEDTPVAVIHKATWEDEKVVEGSLKDIAEKVRREGIDRQAIIVVGEAIGREGDRSRLYHPDFRHGYRKGP